MEKSQIGLSWSFRTRSDGNYQSTEAWPEFGHKSQVKLSTSKNIEGATARIHLDSTEYPELTETAAKIRSTVSTQKFSNLSHTSSTSVSDSQETVRSKSWKRHRTDKIDINLGEVLQSSWCSRKIHAKVPTKVRANVSKPQRCTSVSNVTDGKNDPEIRKKRICISKSKKPSRLKEMILLERKIKAQINMHKSALFEHRTMDTISEGVRNINFSPLRITTNNDVQDDSVKHTTNDGLISESPDVVEKLNGILVRGNCAQYHSSVQSALNASKLSRWACSRSKKRRKRLESSDNKVSLKHSRNFREYCTNTLTAELNKSLERFLNEITRLQRMHYERDHNKAKYKRRYYSGLKEVRKQTDRSKVKFVVLAPDIEKIVLEGGLDDEVESLLEACEKRNVVFCFGLRRRKLGYYTHGKGLVGCIGIANYNGTEEIFQDVLLELARARNAFKQLRGETDGTIDISKLQMDDYLLTEGINMLMKILGAADAQNCK